MKADAHAPNAYREQSRRRIAVRKLIDETGNADLLEWVEHADMESMNHDAAVTFMGEWATQIRESLPDDFDFGCGCASCTITRGLNHLCSLRGAVDDYLLWEPRKAGHAQAHRELTTALRGVSS